MVFLLERLQGTRYIHGETRRVCDGVVSEGGGRRESWGGGGTVVTIKKFRSKIKTFKKGVIFLLTVQLPSS